MPWRMAFVEIVDCWAWLPRACAISPFIESETRGHAEDPAGR